ncbi:hypothetical protein MUK70_28925 [Dyadobacter chenwenxiniae]|uniref:Outer membrane protein beta-barrel domain-containing protein n=1 Tax=Dyadobacter chenwenxiniae TaxID=2906456 RepID=A0A9X1PP64_9BACT|nr:hypothetical protein [Dyadobacter chenwenxiniae]MCF0064907.1 hypothetical protein [Dyadobacter chenwenxiniae]UON83029.1 hypothetical protein MUK70_28925 [Dyadobacter chenwenxiniae]
MKTNKFEDTIRRKLESIEPDFQEKDWANMQRYMRAQSPPSFWQQHSSWIGYAAAASVSMVMAFMYVSQRTQNNHLTADVKKLQHQIEAIKNAPTLAEKPDTVYLIKKGDGSDELIALSAADNDIPIAPKGTLASRKTVISRGGANANNRRAENLAQPVSDIVAASSNPGLANVDGGSGSAGNNDNFVQSSAGAERLTIPAGIQVGLQQPVDIHNNRFDVNKMKYNLVNRISKHQYQQALLASNIQKSALPASGKKTEQVAQAETIIPKLDLKVPYRFGAGIATDGVGKTKSVSGEVLIARKFSISAGISWLKVKPMEFFNEKLFREKSRRDFRGEHPGEVPVALKVYNIRVDPTVVQIPLTVAFRNNIKDNWAYYAGAGTNFTVSAKEKVSFDAKGANYAYMNQHFEAKSDVPLISSVNLTMGLEKTWYPIVVQAEGYLYAYFNQLTPLSQSAGPGVKVKLMYQIGGKM